MTSDVETIDFDSPLGRIRATASSSGISALSFIEHPTDAPILTTANLHLVKLRAELDRYFDGKLRAFTVPVDLRGTPFRLRVWEELSRIPFSKTISYVELATRVGNAKASRAVGGANGANPVCILIPCHRVVAADGSLGGYSAGLWRKEKLLALERGTGPV